MDGLLLTGPSPSSCRAAQALPGTANIPTSFPLGVPIRASTSNLRSQKTPMSPVYLSLKPGSPKQQESFPLKL